MKTDFAMCLPRQRALGYMQVFHMRIFHIPCRAWEVGWRMKRAVVVMGLCIVLAGCGDSPPANNTNEQAASSSDAQPSKVAETPPKPSLADKQTAMFHDQLRKIASRCSDAFIEMNTVVQRASGDGSMTDSVTPPEVSEIALRTAKTCSQSVEDIRRITIPTGVLPAVKASLRKDCGDFYAAKGSMAATFLKMDVDPGFLNNTRKSLLALGQEARDRCTVDLGQVTPE